MAIDATARSATAPPAPSVPPHRSGVATTTLGLVVATLAGGALAIGLAMRAIALVAATPVRTVDSLVEVGVCGVGALVAGWLALSALLALGCLTVRLLGSSWRLGERLVHRCAPVVVRRALVLVVGASVGLGAATGASAAVSPTPAPTATVAAGTAASVAADDYGWVVTTTVQSAAEPGPASAPTAPPLDGSASGSAPAEPARTPTPAAPPVAAPVAPVATPVQPAAVEPVSPASPNPSGDVVVVSGDSLWAIAARHLAPEATDAEIAASWPQWYHANASVIGPDPGRIVPGQTLTAPAAQDGAAS